MTKKKARIVAPHTTNAAASGSLEFDAPLRQVIGKFADSGVAEAVAQILKAVTAHNLAVKLNPQRQRAQDQRDDRSELIESMRELNIRLNPVHVPLPLLNAVREAYRARDGGKSTVDDEIRDLLLRLLHLQTLFEASTIPFPNWTNPGKPERGRLLRDIERVFDNVTCNAYLPSPDNSEGDSASALAMHRAQDKRLFVEEVFRVLQLPEPPA
jgi:hypothetical protein